MKKILVFLCVMMLVFGLTISTHATLIDLGGGMVYSTDMDVTWLLDANYARTTLYDADGYMTWQEANTWAENLDYGGYRDWRLPTFDPDYNRDDPELNSPTGADLSEMAYLRYIELTPYGSSLDPSPFINLIDLVNWVEPWYWSGTLTGTDNAWRFDFECG